MSIYILSSYIAIFCEEAAVHCNAASLYVVILTLFTANKLLQLISSYWLILWEKHEDLYLEGGQYYVLLPPQEEMIQSSLAMNIA